MTSGAIPWTSGCHGTIAHASNCGDGAISTIDPDADGTIGYTPDPPTPPEQFAFGFPVQADTTGAGFIPSAIIMVDALDETTPSPPPPPPNPPHYSGRLGTGETPPGGGGQAEF